MAEAPSDSQTPSDPEQEQLTKDELKGSWIDLICRAALLLRSKRHGQWVSEPLVARSIRI